MSAEFISEWVMLAQEAAPAAADEQTRFWMSLLPYLPIVVLLYLMIIQPQRREQKKRDQMLGAMKKNDRVVTSAGIIGTVANISADGKEITLKVDDNTRIRFLRSSITHVLGEEANVDAAARPA